MAKIPFIVQGKPSFAPSGDLIEIGPSSGSVKDGTLLLDIPAPEDLDAAYYHLPAGAAFDGSLAGWYRIEFTSPTTGRICERRDEKKST